MHPEYVALKAAHRTREEHKIDQDLEDNDDVFIWIRLPYAVEDNFHDPLVTDQSRLDFGVFPLPDQTRTAGAPAPSCKLLHLHCKDARVRRIVQSPQQVSYFDPPVHGAPERFGSSSIITKISIIIGVCRVGRTTREKNDHGD